MTAIKERIIGAVTIMNDSDAEKFWNIILNTFTPSRDNIEDVEPDEIEALLEGRKNRAENGTIPHEAINWD